MSAQEVVADILEHHGVKGMQWGVRNRFNTSAPTSSSSNVKGSENFPKAQAASMNNVAKKMEQAYGFKIDEFKPISKTENYINLPDAEKVQYLAVVLPKTHGSLHNAVLVSDDPGYIPTLKRAQAMGWFAPTDSKHVVEANLTHEAAHGLFHQSDASGKGATYNNESLIFPLRQKAWAKAEQQALKDGDITRSRFTSNNGSQFQMGNKISKYAGQSPFIQEHEAEAFAAYHWSPNPPKFVDTFMTDVHSSMGIEVQPFSGRKVSHGS